MWAPHPKGRIIRRPQPDFSHRWARIQRRPAPKDLPNSEPDPRRNYKYFGIHRSDITDHLKQTIPSHAFHPSLVGAPPPVTSSRHPRNSEKKRPETAPGATVWFGRTCSDVSDWLRFRPPAHLGLDPDNKPLPYYPTSTSIVTDAKWQTKEFPALPNVLFHWWADRPSSVPLASNPHQVKFGTLVEALKHRIVRPPGPYTPASAATPRSGAQTPRDQGENGIHTPRGQGESGHNGIQTPRSQGESSQKGIQTPRGLGESSQNGNQTPQGQGEHSRSGSQTPRGQGESCQNGAQTPRGETTRSRAQTPRGETPRSNHLHGVGSEVALRSVAGCEGARLPGEFTSRSRPSSAPSATSRSHLEAMPSPSSTPRANNGSMEFSLQPPSTPRPRSAAESPKAPGPLGPCGCTCGKPPDTPRSGCSSRGAKGTLSLPRAPYNVGSPGVEVSKCACRELTSMQAPSLRGGGACTPPLPSKPAIPAAAATFGKPPPSPRLSHPNPPHVPKQAVPRKPCDRHPAAVPPGLFVQGKGQVSNTTAGKNSIPRVEMARASHGPTVEDMRRMSPNAFATQVVWAEKFKQHGQGAAWPSQENKANKAVKAY